MITNGEKYLYSKCYVTHNLEPKQKKKNQCLTEITLELNISLTLPEIEALISFFEISSATNEVATLRRGILNSFEM